MRDFGWALFTLETGRCVRRKSWPSELEFLTLFEDRIVIKREGEYVLPWVVPQEDVLAKDWELPVLNSREEVKK
jgi:hypothetical protein